MPEYSRKRAKLSQNTEIFEEKGKITSKIHKMCQNT